MKKLAIVALALVLAMTFVGCGIQDGRFVGTWDYNYDHISVSGEAKPWKVTRFEFNKDGTVISNDMVWNYVGAEGTLKKTANTQKEGTWLVINNEILEIEDHSSNYNGKWEVEFSGLTKMKWTLKKGSKVVNLVKVTKKTEADAE